MGGVDLLDSLSSIYRPYARSKRYYFRVFLHILDLTAVNAWLLYKRNAMSKRNVLGRLMKKRGRPSNESIKQASQEKRKRGPRAPAPTKDVRLDQAGHWVPLEPEAAALQSNCFFLYHTTK
ncbi:hypothetical protein MRX96_017872 [Rhipicephalus microplus]